MDRLKILLRVFAILIGPHFVAADAGPISSPMCIGPNDAKHYVVYLHGIDSTEHGPQEQNHRIILAKIAQKLGLKIARPRAKEKCGENTCWGWALTDEKAREALPVIEEAARCFPKNSRFGIIGFSSGGYLAAKLFRACILPGELKRADWIVTVGATMMKGPIEPNPKDLSRCGRMTMLVGTKDRSNRDPKRNYFHLLRAKGAQVTYKEFEGGHELIESELETAIQAYIKK